MWADIDFAKSIIRVEKSVKADGNAFTVKRGGKTDSATRNVIIPDALCKYLAAQPRTSLYVCPNARGGLHTTSSWKRLWESYEGELDRRYGLTLPPSKSKYAPKKRPVSIARITPHMLRHTYASVLYRSRVDVMTAKEQMGHSDISITLGVYTHLDTEFKANSIAKMDDFLNNGSQLISDLLQYQDL
jgi:integrase